MNGNDAKKMMKEALENIKGLMQQENWRDAHRACLEILRFDPENIKVIRLKSKIEKTVAKINRGAIEQDLKNLEPLWKEKKYGEMLDYLRQLQPYAAEYPKINSLIIKTDKAYKLQLLEQQESYISQEINDIKGLADSGQFQEAVRRAEKLRVMQLREDEIVNLLKDLKKRWIENEIRRNAGLINSEKYEDILIMYHGLLLIDGKSEKVKILVEDAKKKYQMYKIQQKRELIYKLFEKIKTLYQLGRYEQAIELAEEILDADPSNKGARFYLEKAEKKAEKNMDREIYLQMKNARKQMKEEMKTKRDKFTRI